MAQVAELQQLIATIREQRGFTTDPVRVLTLLTEEVGEIAGELKKTWSSNYGDLVVSDLADELADVFVLVSALATSYDIDLEQAVMAKFVDADSVRSWATAEPANRDD